MHVISFKDTALFKRGIWLTAAALVIFVAAPSAFDSSWRHNPVPTAIALVVLGACLGYFFRRTQIHRLADQVVDCEDHLKVRRGRVEVAVAWAQVSRVEVASFSGIHRITIRTHQPTKLGAQIEFLPQASLWSNLSGIKRLAANLSDRATPRLTP
jgi:hypothetical protein